MGEWHGIQVYCYAEKKDDLILDCVRPLFDRLAPHVDRLFFTRHWLRGPHLRLSFHAPGAVHTGVIRPETERAVTRYLTEHPSTVTVNEREMLAIHRAVAVQEQEPGPLEPLHPDNSIQNAPYDRRIAVLGSTAAAELLESFYTETNAAAFARFSGATLAALEAYEKAKRQAGVEKEGGRK